MALLEAGGPPGAYLLQALIAAEHAAGSDWVAIAALYAQLERIRPSPKLLRRLGREEEAVRAYDRALALAGNDAVRSHLAERRSGMMSG